MSINKIHTRRVGKIKKIKESAQKYLNNKSSRRKKKKKEQENREKEIFTGTMTENFPGLKDKNSDWKGPATAQRGGEKQAGAIMRFQTLERDPETILKAPKEKEHLSKHPAWNFVPATRSQVTR